MPESAKNKKDQTANSSIRENLQSGLSNMTKTFQLRLNAQFQRISARHGNKRVYVAVAYIENALEHETTIEIWHIWLMGYYEYDERPVIRKTTVSFADISAHDIREIDNAEIWNQPDKQNPGRPSFYCLTVER